VHSALSCFCLDARRVISEFQFRIQEDGINNYEALFNRFDCAEADPGIR